MVFDNVIMAGNFLSSHLVSLGFWVWVSCFSGWSQTCCVTKDDLELLTLPIAPQCWDYELCLAILRLFGERESPDFFGWPTSSQGSWHMKQGGIKESKSRGISDSSLKRRDQEPRNSFLFSTMWAEPQDWTQSLVLNTCDLIHWGLLFSFCTFLSVPIKLS